MGHSSSYSDSFVDGMGIIYETIVDKGCSVVGSVPSENYSYNTSRADIGGLFAGLALDDDNEYDKTDSRINDWIRDICPKLQ